MRFALFRKCKLYCFSSLFFVFFALIFFSKIFAEEVVFHSIKHVAIIADGNRRWAKEHHLKVSEGHKRGIVHRTPILAKDLWDMGVHTVTVWAFSPANWNRGSEEVAHLMRCFEELLKEMLVVAENRKAKIVHLGRKDRLPDFLLQIIYEVEAKTAFFSEHVFNIGIDFGGKDEIIRACQKAWKKKGGKESLLEEDISQCLDTADQMYPSPDLVIRTSGEMRLSGFMLWQSIYSELYFTELYYPDLDRLELEKAIQSFYKRQRTFGR